MSKTRPKVVQGARKYQQHGLAKRQAIAYAKRGIRRAERRAQSDAEVKHDAAPGSTSSGGEKHG